MFTRQDYKRNAWQILSQNYWMPFLMCFIYAIVSGGLNFTYRSNNDFFKQHKNNFFDYLAANPFIIFTIIMFAFIGIAIGTAFSFFITKPFYVSKSKFFLTNCSVKSDFDTISYSFKKGQYLNIVGCMAWRSFVTFLWSLLLIIPGIIKGYSYCLVPYILSDNPHINYKRALEISDNMTRGHKFDIFVLQLSFLGWYLLGLLCCCIGTLFVNPYYDQTFAQMYISLRDNAINDGKISRDELNLSQEVFYN